MGTGFVSEDLSEFYGVASKKKMTETFVHLFFRGILCNILVCLSVLMNLNMKEETARLIMIWWCLFAFVTCGFEHSVANMTLLTIALFDGNASYSNDVTAARYFYNLSVVGLGNLAGAFLFLAVPYFITGTSRLRDGNVCVTFDFSLYLLIINLFIALHAHTFFDLGHRPYTPTSEIPSLHPTSKIIKYLTSTEAMQLSANKEHIDSNKKVPKLEEVKVEEFPTTKP